MAALTESIGMYSWQLDGINAGIITSIEGGTWKADKADTKMGTDFLARKTIVGITLDPVTVKMAVSQCEPVQQWIEATLKADYAFKNGEIVAADMKKKAVRTFQFTSALLTEIGMPQCEGNSKNLGFITLKFQCTDGKWQAGGGADIGLGNQGNLKIKNWTESNYKLAIDGLDCSRVSKIGAFTMKQNVERDAIGETRKYQYVPVNVEIPDLEITSAEATAEAMYAWHEDFVINGNCGNDKEKGGTLTYLDQSLKTELGSIAYNHVGIYELSTVKAESHGKELKRVTAKLYVEEVKVTLGVKD